MTGTSLFHADLRAELHAYTLNVMRKVHQRFGVDYEELLQAILGEADVLAGRGAPETGTRTCEAVLKKTKLPCARPALEGCGAARCKLHARVQKLDTETTDIKTKTNDVLQLEYALVNEKPYLIDPIKGTVYAYEKEPYYLGQIDMFQAVQAST